MAVLGENTKLKELDSVLNILHQKYFEREYRLTPFIVTVCQSTTTEIEFRNLLEAGLRIIRFKMSHIARKDKVILLMRIKKAIVWCCEKYLVSSWPVTISVDVPNACIRTGYLKDELTTNRIYLEVGKIVEVTCEVEYWNKCDDKRIFIDDPYTLETIKPNTEISLEFGEITMICTEVINNLSIKCKVITSGFLTHGQFVCIRGARLLRPTLTKLDKQLLAFVKEYKLDVITVHAVQSATTLAKVRAFFKECDMPMIISTICDQEGLDNLDEIIEASDGIILAREFLGESLEDVKKLLRIQLYVSGKCKRLGKPFYISGNVLEETLRYGTVACNELSDITNAVMQGAGLVFKHYTDTNSATITTAINLLESVCKNTEAIYEPDHFWRLCIEKQPPVTAAEAVVLACALTARQSGSAVVIVLTVTGRTAVQLAYLQPEAVILTVSASLRVARRLQLYRGILPIVYDRKSSKNWYADMESRIKFAVAYGRKKDLLKYKQTFVVLRKAAPTSAFCDQISLWQVVDEEMGIVCPDDNMPAQDADQSVIW